MSARKASSIYLLDLEKETKKLLEQLDLDTPNESGDSESELDTRTKTSSHGKATTRLNSKSKLGLKTSDLETDLSSKTISGLKLQSGAKGKTGSRHASDPRLFYESPSSSEQDEEKSTGRRKVPVSSIKTKSPSQAKVFSDSDHSDLKEIIRDLQKMVNSNGSSFFQSS
jgi:hypothetical protein